MLAAFAVVILLGMIGAMATGISAWMFFMYGGQMFGQMFDLLFKLLSYLFQKQ